MQELPNCAALPVPAEVCSGEVLEPDNAKMAALLLQHGVFFKYLIETHLPKTSIRLVLEKYPFF